MYVILLFLGSSYFLMLNKYFQILKVLLYLEEKIKVNQWLK